MKTTIRFALLVMLLVATAGCGSGKASTPGHRLGKPMHHDVVIATKSVSQSTSTPVAARTSRPHAPAPLPSRQVNGTLKTEHGIQVLRVWGSPDEMGYAHGYLLAPQIIEVLEHFLAPAIEMASPEWTHKRLADAVETRILWPNGYDNEFDAMARGMVDALGDMPTLDIQGTASGGVQIDAETLLLLNAIHDLLGLSPSGCSAAVWGERTDDDHLFACGNWQGPWNALNENMLLIVRTPDKGLATVCVGTVGMVSCLAGMNEHGVVAMSQVTEGSQAGVDSTHYADPGTRRVLEGTSQGSDMVATAARLIEAHPGGASSVTLVAQDHSAALPLSPDEVAVMIEHDKNGIALRRPSENALHGRDLEKGLIATSHFLARPASRLASNDSIRRYEAIDEAIGERPIAHLSDMQRIARAGDPEGRAQRTVYFEPGAHLVHIAIRSSPSIAPSPHLKPVTFTWNELMGPLEALADTHPQP